MTRATAAKQDRERVLRLLTSQGPLSQAQLTRLTQIKEPAVVGILQELTALQLIRECGSSPATRHTPREPLLGLSPASAWAAGLDLHGIGAKLCLINGTGQILAQETFPPQQDIVRFAKELAPAIEQHAKRLNLDYERFAGVGVSVPGIVNPLAGTVSKVNWNWKNFALGDLLAKEIGAKVRVERDVSCGAYGEKHVGLARNCDNFLYILIHPRREKTAPPASQSYAYGLAIVVEGQIHRGSNYAAGEFDEVLTLDPMKVEMKLDSDGNPSEQETSDLLHSLGRTAASLTNLIDPELIILCADRHLLTPERMKEVDKVARQEIKHLEDRRFKLISSSIGINGLSYGAAILRLHRSFQERLRNP